MKRINCSAADSRSFNIGLLALDIDNVIEDDLRGHLNRDDTAIITSRLRTGEYHDDDPYPDLEGSIKDCLGGIFPSRALDAIVFGCTTGIITVGYEKVREIIRSVRPDTPVIDPFTSCVQYLVDHDMRNIGLITPYTEELSKRVVTSLQDSGIYVSSCSLLEVPKTEREEQPATSSYDLAIDALLADTPIDAIFISCTALRTTNLLDRLEDRFQIPVLSSNSVLAEGLKAALASQ